MTILHFIVKWQTKSGQRFMKQIRGYITYETHRYVLYTLSAKHFGS